MIFYHEDGGGGGEGEGDVGDDDGDDFLGMVMTLMIVCEECMLIEDKVKASCLHFPRRMQGGNDDASLMISAQRVPDTQPKPELFSIPNQYPNFFQNLQEFGVSGISENKAFSPYSSVIPFLAIRTSTSIILYIQSIGL